MSFIPPAQGRVAGFLEELGLLEGDRPAIVQACREMVFRRCPQAGERMMYGGIMFSCGGEDMGGVFVNAKHVSFEFGRGFEFDDPRGVLEGKGKFRRHLKLRRLEDVGEKDAEGFVSQAVALIVQK